MPRAPKIGRAPTAELFDYCQTHGISMDWLISGDLKSLQRMREARRMRTEATTPASLREKLARLSESEREINRKKVDELMLT